MNQHLESVLINLVNYSTVIKVPWLTIIVNTTHLHYFYKLSIAAPRPLSICYNIISKILPNYLAAIKANNTMVFIDRF